MTFHCDVESELKQKITVWGEKWYLTIYIEIIPNVNTGLSPLDHKQLQVDIGDDFPLRCWVSELKQKITVWEKKWYLAIYIEIIPNIKKNYILQIYLELIPKIKKKCLTNLHRIHSKNDHLS